MIADVLKKILFGGLGGLGRYSVRSETEQKIQRDWDYIKTLLQQKSPAQLKQALITADKSMDSALRDIADGETMGERLKNSRNRFDQVVYNHVWEAHKVRNALVHESGYEPPYYVLTDSVEKLKKGLTSLGVRI